MMNITRGEPFTVEISLDVDREALESLELIVMQRGKLILQKNLEDAMFDADEKHAFITLDGEETAQFRAGVPAYAQSRATLVGGERLHSEVEEINLTDLLGERKVRAWS